jgi:hypothetical protein
VTSGIHFDGALDLHISSQPVGLFEALTEQVVAWGLISVLFWLSSLVLARQGRVVDFFVNVGIARIPLVMLGAILSLVVEEPNEVLHMAFSNPLHPMLWVVVVIGMAFVGWFFVLLYNGFKTASGLAGGRLVGAFVWTLIVAEIGSKILLAGGLPWGTGPTPNAVLELPGDTYPEKAESFLQLLENDEYEAAWRTFSPKMAESLSRLKLEAIWRASRLKRGALRAVDERRMQARDEFHIVDLICSFENERGVIRVVFDSAGRTGGLWMLDPDSALPPRFKID